MQLAAAALASALACIPPSARNIMQGFAERESGLQAYAIHDNSVDATHPKGSSYAPATLAEAASLARGLLARGHSSLDIGVAQVWTGNFDWLGLTIETALDPCRSFASGWAVLVARYNGNAAPSVKIAYVADVNAKIQAIDAAPGADDHPRHTARAGAPSVKPPNAPPAHDDGGLHDAVHVHRVLSPTTNDGTHQNETVTYPG